MKNLPMSIMISLLAVSAVSADVPKSEEEKTLYAVGLAVSRELSVFRLTPSELEFVKQGITDGITGRPPALSLDDYNQKIQELANGRRLAHGKKLSAETKSFMEKAAKEKGAVRTDSGLIYIPIKEGTGPSPAATDRVKVNYRGALIDGSEFDSSYKRGQPAEFPLKGVIRCWTEGLQRMKSGEKAKLVCPAELAYGRSGSGVIPPDAALVFEIELLEVKRATGS